MPAVVHVGPHVYEVREAPDMDDLGDISFENQEIRIRPVGGRSQQQDSLLHEVLHALTDLTGVAYEIGGAEDEKLVRRLAPALLDVLRRNPALLRYLES